MVITVIIGILLVVSLLVNIFKAIKNKDYVSLVIGLLTIPFIVFMTSSIFLGGSAYNDASKKYELYEEGCYYLISHNIYTKVSKVQYDYMKIIEPIAIITFIMVFPLSIINQKKRKNKID